MNHRRTSRLYAAVERVERAEWLDRPGDAAAAAIRETVIPPGRFKDLLSGTWFGHALHPLLTDLPVGLWCSSLVLDLTCASRAQAAADRLIKLGILAAIPAGLTGAADWGDTQPRERRVGLVHATVNITALGLYGASLRARGRGRRRRGVALSVCGAGALGVGGYLGGHLVFALGLGVDRTAFESRPENWTDVAAERDLLDGAPFGVTIDGAAIVLVRSDGAIHALADRCTHRGAPLHQGRVRDDCIVCPWHGGVFRLSDGAIVHGPATTPAPRYDVVSRDGRVLIRIPPTDAS